MAKMIRGKSYYFFRLDHFKDDPNPEYRVACSLEDLYFRFGHSYVGSFFAVVQLNELTIEHILAIDDFLLQQIS